MDWDADMAALNEHQRFLEDFLEACQRRQGGLAQPISQIDRLLDSMETNPHRYHRALAAILKSQTAFNKTVITMLTDLDHRKSEAEIES